MTHNISRGFTNIQHRQRAQSQHHTIYSTATFNKVNRSITATTESSTKEITRIVRRWKAIYQWSGRDNSYFKFIIRSNNKRPHRIPKKCTKIPAWTLYKKAPFRHIDASIYYQKDGVAIGSSLGPTFAKFCMAQQESKISDIDTTPHIYCRYVNGIFVMIDSEEQLLALKEKFQNASVAT